MAESFQTTRYQRRRGERITDFINRFDEAIQRLPNDGVSFGEEQHVSSGFFLQWLSLAAERRERVAAALQDKDYKLEQVKSIVIQMFPELHMVELRHRAVERPRTTAHHGGTNVSKKGGGKSHGAMAAKLESDKSEEATSEADDLEDLVLDDMQGVVREGLEALAADLDVARDFFTPEGAAAREDAAVCPEAPQAVREVRKHLGRGLPASRGHRGGGLGESNGHTTGWAPNGGGRALADKIRARKAKSACHACGRKDHWAGDSECLQGCRLWHCGRCTARHGHKPRWPVVPAAPSPTTSRTSSSAEPQAGFEPGRTEPLPATGMC